MVNIWYWNIFFQIYDDLYIGFSFHTHNYYIKRICISLRNEYMVFNQNETTSLKSSRIPEEPNTLLNLVYLEENIFSYFTLTKQLGWCCLKLFDFITWYLMPLSTIFQLYVGWGNQSTRLKPLICHKSLTNFIT